MRVMLIYTKDIWHYNNAVVINCFQICNEKVKEE